VNISQGTTALLQGQETMNKYFAEIANTHEQSAITYEYVHKFNENDL
jgi:hypothetical protein